MTPGPSGGHATGLRQQGTGDYGESQAGLCLGGSVSFSRGIRVQKHCGCCQVARQEAPVPPRTFCQPPIHPAVTPADAGDATVHAVLLSSRTSGCSLQLGSAPRGGSARWGSPPAPCSVSTDGPRGCRATGTKVSVPTFSRAQSWDLIILHGDTQPCGRQRGHPPR